MVYSRGERPDVCGTRTRTQDSKKRTDGEATHTSREEKGGGGERECHLKMRKGVRERERRREKKGVTGICIALHSRRYNSGTGSRRAMPTAARNLLSVSQDLSRSIFV